MPEYNLDNAYRIDGPDDARRYYDEWAASYDSTFTEAWGYVAPARIAGIFSAGWTAGDAPVLDIGAGTGEVARHMPGLTVDGIDISAEMLAQAEAKGLYRRCILGDLTKPLDLPDGAYHGVVSSGTFTHGHVGPECLSELLRVTAPGALFVCGTIPSVYDEEKFGSALALLVAEGRIEPVAFHLIDIYEKAEHPHAADRGLVMQFRKL
jgi:SAM-dependent methyltransferase